MPPCCAARKASVPARIADIWWARGTALGSQHASCHGHANRCADDRGAGCRSRRRSATATGGRTWMPRNMSRSAIEGRTGRPRGNERPASGLGPGARSRRAQGGPRGETGPAARSHALRLANPVASRRGRGTPINDQEPVRCRVTVRCRKTHWSHQRRRLAEASAGRTTSAPRRRGRRSGCGGCRPG